MQLLYSYALLCVSFLCSASLLAQEEDASKILSLRDGDRVVFLGNSFFERALDHGHLEASLTMRWPDKKISFRNLGWDGDTVYGHSRAGGRRRQVFGDPEEGFKRMTEHLNAENPSLIFIAYGFNESFDGTQGLASFQKGLNRLLDAVETHTKRIVIITPPAIVGQQEAANVALGRYAEILLETARQRELFAVDLFGNKALEDMVFRENGLHLSDEGYRKTAKIWAQELNLPPLKISHDDPRAEKIRQAIIKKNTLYFIDGDRGTMRLSLENVRTNKKSPRKNLHNSSPLSNNRNNSSRTF
jgi:lysophospholipase L1-like esterase